MHEEIRRDAREQRDFRLLQEDSGERNSRRGMTFIPASGFVHCNATIPVSSEEQHVSARKSEKNQQGGNR